MMQEHAAALSGMRLISRRRGEYAGPCPYCRDGDDRFHLWTEPDGARPAGRYWCRVCGASGVVRAWRDVVAHATPRRSRRHAEHDGVYPTPEHIPQYRTVYELTALWAHQWLFDDSNSDPLSYVCSRGLTRADAGRFLLGYSLNDASALPAYLQDVAPELLRCAEAAGVLARDDGGVLRTHPVLRGTLIFPVFADGEIVDLRTRRPGAGQRGRSLPGSPIDRGGLFPIGWDAIGSHDTVVLTESSEFKALVPLAAHEHDRLDLPTLGVPGLTAMPPDLGKRLVDHGVRTVILAFDVQPRPVVDGEVRLAPEERWSLMHGARLQGDGLQVRVARLPLAPNARKADLDGVLLDRGAVVVQRTFDEALPLTDYARSLPRSLWDDRLPVFETYPTRRPCPRQIEPQPVKQPEHSPMSLTELRQHMREQVAEHIQAGNGMLVLAHPPGAGKGYATVAGIQGARVEHHSADLVWTAARSAQIHDQTGLELTPLFGRNERNCRRVAEAHVLAAKGYAVMDALCRSRCPFAGSCAYLAQFDDKGDRFAALPLLQATHWWQDAGVLVLDEFDPARLTRIVSLTSAEIAAMYRATGCGHAHAILRWTARVVVECADCSISGVAFYRALETEATADGLDFAATLRTAIARRPDRQQTARLAGYPHQMELRDFECLPPGYLDTLLEVYGREMERRLAGKPFTSRVEAASGRLILALRHERMIDELAVGQRPMIILDGTAQPVLLRALFPDQQITFESSDIRGTARVVQVVGQDWAKSTLTEARRERWYDTIAGHIRPGCRTLVVVTQSCEDDVHEGLQARGCDMALVTVGHYGNMRGSNAYCGYDVVLAQVYHPQHEALIREARALFADDDTPLDERVMVETRQLYDTNGNCWEVSVPTFADARLAALLETRREAEMAQCALRGRPLDHPDVQITILGSLPLPGIVPTEIVESRTSGRSNCGRQAEVRSKLIAAGQKLLQEGKQQIDVGTLAKAAVVSVNTVRAHWGGIGEALGLFQTVERRRQRMPHGGWKTYAVAVLARRMRGRRAPPRSEVTACIGSGLEPRQESLDALANPRRCSGLRSKRQSHTLHFQRVRRRVRAPPQ